jgi:GH35 family endo-1,4-beta-xylanase
MKKRITSFLTIYLIAIYAVVAQTGMPSCVITAPHSNAYFQAGKAITIKVYASDIGGTTGNGTVSKVEFFNGDTKLGEATSHTSFTYTYVWNCVIAGTHILKAKSTDNSGNVSTSAGVKIVVGTAAATAKGLSAGKGKYFGNIIAGSVPQNYNTYWNAVTAENDCKWGSVESTRDVMNWTGADRSFNHAKNNNMAFRYHALAWGNQYPCWAIRGQGCSGGNNSGTPTLQISATEFQQEIEEYMAAVAARYGNDIDQLDVLNENLQFGDGGEHAPATGVFRSALGGNGTTGYDWVVWLFTKARQYFPNSKLILNDYGLENDQSAINRQLNVLKVLRDKNLVDGFGTQAHEFNVNNLSANQLQSALDLMDNSGVPTYVTELDISGSDSEQNTRYQNLLPVYWNHASVAGITLWGYIEGTTWIANTGLVSSGNNNPTESPAMQSIKTFVTGRTNVGYPYATQESASGCVNNNPPTVSITSPANNATFAVGANITITATAFDNDGTVSKVEYFNGTTKLGESTSSPTYSYTWNAVAEGNYTITAKATDNSGNVTTSSAISIKVGNPSTNLLTNGEFDNGTTDWAIQNNSTGNGTMSVVTTASLSGTNALRICPTAAGTADWHVQVSTDAFVTESKTYTISFMAKADAARTMTVSIQQNGSPYKTIYGQSLNLTATNQSYSYTFTSDTTDNGSKLKFYVGNNTSCVYIDKVVFQEGDVITGSDESAFPKTMMQVYPNPFSDQIHVEAAGVFYYQLFDHLGKLLETGNGKDKIVLTNSLPSGLYMVKVTQEQHSKVFKIVKE